ncbi:MAG: endopeptidase La [Chthonomonadaceae bacterium]|nr:endopeptidase La [Chthonomonadaceae bacterium]
MPKLDRSDATPAPPRRRLIPVLAVRDTVHFPNLINTVHVARESSLRAVRRALETDRRVLVLSQRDMSVEDPSASDLCRIGTLSETLQALPMPDATLRAVLRGTGRVEVRHLVKRGSIFYAEAIPVSTVPAHGVEADALMRECLDSLEAVIRLGDEVPPEALPAVAHLDDAGALADAIAHHLPLKPLVKQGLLEEVDDHRRLDEVLRCLRREMQVLEMRADIKHRVDREVADVQREYYLREQLRVIQTELDERGARVSDAELLRERIASCGISGSSLDKALAEVDRLDRTPPSSPEAVVLRNYLEWIAELPWSRLSEDRLDVKAAASLLDQQHYGLQNVKGRILDFLAVRQLNQTLRGPILCFVGPPGVGKTSLGRSIAEAMDRSFHRLSLGGVRDEAEIRGHRRTYVGARPGCLAQAMRTCGTRNPVLVLDEIDKMGHDLRGDPTSALLEALDPEQNARFVDHYLELPLDLSAVLFIATANVLEEIPAPLLDRMEIIRFPSYTSEEKVHIATRFLIPRAIRENGLLKFNLDLHPDVPALLVDEYTREAGVRSLERVVDELCRKVARQAAGSRKRTFRIGMPEVSKLLGIPRYPRDSSGLRDRVGAATGLVVTEAGGDVVQIEASVLEPLGPSPVLHLTGNLGNVMKESAQAAMTYIRATQPDWAPGRTLRHDVHIHVPAAATPKDGPSAGLTIGVALASALSGAAVRGDVAMTGELTLRGNVLAVGGVRDKVLAAHRAGITTVILPEENRIDLGEIPESIQKAVRLQFVETMDQALAIALRPTGTTHASRRGSAVPTSAPGQASRSGRSFPAPGSR